MLVDTIRYQATHDRLTGLSNRMSILERMSYRSKRRGHADIALYEAKASGKSVAVRFEWSMIERAEERIGGRHRTSPTAARP